MSIPWNFYMEPPYEDQVLSVGLDRRQVESFLLFSTYKSTLVTINLLHYQG